MKMEHKRYLKDYDKKTLTSKQSLNVYYLTYAHSNKQLQWLIFTHGQ